MIIFMQNKICFISVDVEIRFQRLGNVDEILDIFKKYESPATLFVIGEVLEKYREIIAEWGNNYEIACHSYTHRFWNTLTSEERERELDKFIELYQNIFDKKPFGFRAPSHVIDDAALELLERKGFSYDSSIVPHYPPFKKYRGYKTKAPLLPYSLKDRKLLEIPNAGQVLGIPLAGAWIAKLPNLVYKVLFILRKPQFISLSMHSWDALNSEYLVKLDKIFRILKNAGYRFQNGEQIFEHKQ